MKLFVALMAPSLVLFLAACSSNSSSESGDFSAKLTVNGCTNDYHESSKDAFCSALEDESRDKCGMAYERAQTFKTDCGDGFERKNLPAPYTPSQPVPKPMPQPQQPGPSQPSQPAPKPQPQQPATPYEQMQADFAKFGITVTDPKQTSPGYPEPGEMPYYQKLERLTNAMISLESEFAKRASTIKSITPNSYTIFRDGDLDLGVDLDESLVRQYLAIHDQRVQLETRTKMKFEFGIEVYGHEADKLAYYRSIVQAFSISNVSALSSLTPLIQTIEVTDQTHFTFFDHTMKLDRDHYAQDLALELPIAKKLAAMSKFGIEVDGYADPSELAGAVAFADFVQTAKAGFQAVAAISSNPTKLDVQSDDDDPVYISGLTVRARAQFKPTAGLQAMLQLAPVIQALGLKLDMADYHLDADFASAAQKVYSHKAALQAKSGKLKEIYIGGSQSQFSNGTLYVGSDSTADFEKAIASIK